MSDKLNQSVEAGGQAIQSQGDVVIYHGMSSAQMTEIMVAMSKQFSIYQAEAVTVVEKRCEEIRRDVLKEFSEGKRANPEAFKSPDFQYALHEAQKSYARSGDDTLRGTLVDMISRRSLAPERTRLAIALDDAIVKTASLSKNEFAELSLAYILKFTHKRNISNFQKFIDYLKSQIIPFLSDVSEEDSSYLHLEAQGCASIISFSGSNLMDVWKRLYGGVLGKGLTREELEKVLPSGKKDLVDNRTHFLPCLHDQTKLQPNAITQEVFLEQVVSSGLTPEELTSVWNRFANTSFSQQELCDRLRPEIPSIDKLFELWNNTPLQRLSLTTIGFAIGHANAVSKVGFDAPLDIWIK